MSPIESLSHDVRLAVRLLWKSRGVTVLSIVSIALGVGLTAGIFSVEDALLFRPFPIARTAEVLAVSSRGDDGREVGYGWPDYEDMVRAGAALGEFAAYTRRSLLLAREEENELVLTHAATPNYFSLLGVRAALGNATLLEESGGRPPAVLGYRFWMRVFGGDPGAIGKTIVLNRRAFSVAGVMPAEFTGLVRNVATDVWISADQWFEGGRRDERQDRNGQFEIVTRLRPGVSAESAVAQLDAAIRGPDKHKPAPAGTQATVLTARFATDWKKQKNQMIGGGSLIALGLVLFVACANVAQLRLAQAEARRKELGIRFALGAGGWRIVRQLLVESGLIGLAGGGLGLLLARGLMVKAAQFLTAGSSYLDFGLRLDHRVLAFSLGATLFAAILTGLAPSRHAVRLDVAEVLKADQGATGARAGLQQRVLVIGQVAVSVVFFGVAVLSLQSIWNTLKIRPGLDPEKKLFIMTARPGTRTSALSWCEQVCERLAGLPGVRGATFARRLPLSGSGGGAKVRVEIPGQAPLGLPFNSVGKNYFAVMGTRILSGRVLDGNDRDGSPLVMVVSQGFARQVFGDRNPLGEWVQVEGKLRQVVGVAEDGPSNDLHEVPEPFLYLPYGQMPPMGITLMVETVDDPASLAQVIRRELREFDRRAVVYTSTTLRQHMDQALAEDWMKVATSTGLAAFGVLLTAAGLFGVLQYGINRRTREMGLRVALGAGPREIQGLVLRESLRMAVWGAPLGLLMLAGTATYVRSLAPLSTPFNPAAYAAGAVAAVLTVVAAGWVPARRATRVDPLTALRAE